MQTVWVTSPRIEATGLIHQLRDLSNGFFRINGFVVLPYDQKRKGDLSIVMVPDLNYLSIPRIWKRCLCAPFNSWPIEDDELVSDLAELIVRANLPKPKFEEIKEIWEKSGIKIIKELIKISPIFSKIKKIIIHPGVIGTSCSFNLIDDSGIVEIYLRDDQNIFALVEAIVSATIVGDLEKSFDSLWSETELVVDWILMRSSLHNILSKYAKDSEYLPTTIQVKKLQNSKLLTESEEFLRRIGVPDVVSKFNVNEIKGLTLSEKKVLDLLWQQIGNVVSIDEVGEQISDDFSLYAVSKTIQRLRDKLELNGVSGSIIQTIRGQGFLLRKI